MSTVRPTTEATRAGTDPFDLTGRVAPVTGAARGIGRSIAVEPARRGADVVLADMRDPSETVAPLRDGFPAGTREGEAVDVREREQVEKAVSDTAEHFGPMDIPVNNAGTAARASLTGITDDEWFRDIDTNLSGTFLFCRAAISPWMSEQRADAIINISSISGIMGGPTSGSEDPVRKKWAPWGSRSTRWHPVRSSRRSPKTCHTTSASSSSRV